MSFCAGAEIDFLEAAPQNFASNASAVHPAVSLDALTHLDVPIVAGVHARLGGGLGVYVLRDRYVYEAPATTSHELAGHALVAASTDLGLAISLP
jgi:hypothetical protein